MTLAFTPTPGRSWRGMPSPLQHPRSTRSHQGQPLLRLGYVPLVHAAPLLVARHLGLFQRHGLQVRLSAEVGWATIREKIIGGELEAAQALAPMPLAMTLGIGSAKTPCVASTVLNIHGDTLVLSRNLWSHAGTNPAGLRGYRNAEGDPPTLGIVYPHSAQAFLLRQWLLQADLVPDVDFRLVVVPPQQMVAHLKAGHIDGACVGEPWGSLAALSGSGVITAFSADLAPGHPEKVLLVRRAFAESRAPEHAALAAALVEACAWCATPAHHEDLIRLLAAKDGLGVDPNALRPAITGHFHRGAGQPPVHRPDALVFHAPGLHQLHDDGIQWIAACLGVRPPPDLLDSIYSPHTLPAPIPPSTPNPSPIADSPSPISSLPALP